MKDKKFSDFICLDEPQFARSKVPVKKPVGGKGKTKKPRRSEEDLELIREAKRKAKELKEAKVKEVKSKVEKGESVCFVEEL